VDLILLAGMAAVTLGRPSAAPAKD
jgi:hypothetical protein